MCTEIFVSQNYNNKDETPVKLHSFPYHVNYENSKNQKSMVRLEIKFNWKP